MSGASSSMHGLLNRAVNVISNNTNNPNQSPFDPSPQINQERLPSWLPPVSTYKPGTLEANGKVLVYKYPPSKKALRAGVQKLEAFGAKQVTANFENEGHSAKAWTVIKQVGLEPIPTTKQSSEFELWKQANNEQQAKQAVPADKNELRNLLKQELENIKREQNRFVEIKDKIEAVQPKQDEALKPKPANRLKR